MDQDEGPKTMNGGAALFVWRKQYSETLGYAQADFLNYQRGHLLAIAACVESVIQTLVDRPEHPDVVGCVTILEKSEKVRLVTPNKDVVAFVGSLFNSWLLGLLKQDPRTNPFEEPKELAPAGVTIPVGFVIRSVDLVRASDKISGQDHKGILRGILRGLGIPLSSSFGRTLLFYSRAVVVRGKYPDGEVFEFLTQGQPAMGRGPTWPVLSIYTLWCVIAAKAECSRVVGDDALFASSEQGSNSFDERLSIHGGEVNNLKDVTSEIGGTLVERLALLTPDRKIEWHNTISVAVLDGNPKVERAGEHMLPRWMTGPAIPWGPGVEYICEKTFPTEFAKFRRAGIDPFVPREFGGPGFPCSKERQSKALATLRPQWVRALRIAMSQGPEGVGILLKLQGPWKTKAAALVTGDSTRLELLLSAIRDEQNAWGDLPDWNRMASTGLTLEEFARQAEAVLVNGRAMWDGFGQHKQVAVSVEGVAQGLRDVIREVNWLVPKRRLSDNVRKMHKGLEKFLTEVRLGHYRLPSRYRTTPPIGTTLGYRVDLKKAATIDKGALEGLVSYRLEADFVVGLPQAGRGGFLPTGTNLGKEPRYGWSGPGPDRKPLGKPGVTQQLFSDSDESDEG